MEKQTDIEKKKRRDIQKQTGRYREKERNKGGETNIEMRRNTKKSDIKTARCREKER